MRRWAHRRAVVLAISGAVVLVAGVAGAQLGQPDAFGAADTGAPGAAQVPEEPPGESEGETNAALGEAEGEAGAAQGEEGLAAAEATLAEVEAFLDDLEAWVGCVQENADSHADQQANEATRVEDDNFEAADDCGDQPVNPNDTDGLGAAEGVGPEDDGDRGRPEDAGPPADAGPPDDAGREQGEGR